LVASVNLDGSPGAELALGISGLVRIVLFEVQTALGSIFDSQFGVATVTSFILTKIAGNDLLFREGEELSVLEEVETFQDTGSREGPARTALSLILNLGNGTLGSPINLIGKVLDGGGVERLGVLGNDFIVSLVTAGGVGLLEFSFGQVSEWAQTESDAVVFSVELEDLVVVFTEDGVSGFIFTSSVGLIVDALPSRPKGLELSLVDLDGESGNKEEGSDKEDFVHCLEIIKLC